MKVKWDITCECRMLVISKAFDQYRVMYVGKRCETHKGDTDTRNVWKHYLLPE